MHKNILFIFTYLGIMMSVHSQVSLTSDIETISYSTPKEYILGGISIEGTKYLDHKTLIQISGLEIGKLISIPGAAARTN